MPHIRLQCYLCNINYFGPSLTKCCKLLICSDCRDSLYKKGSCVCGKISNSRKICSESPYIFEAIRRYYSDKPIECDRCEHPADIQCINCDRLFCKYCNAYVHNGIGFSKHTRQPHTRPRLSIPQAKRRYLICKVHMQPVLNGCECGNALCLSCLKNHKDLCQKGAKVKSLKEFKEEYFLNVMYKLRQVTFYREKLVEDRGKYEMHYQQQKYLHDNASKAVYEQLKYLQKILAIKSRYIYAKLASYWLSCEKVYLQNMKAIYSNLHDYDDYAYLLYRFAIDYLNVYYLERKIKRVYVNHDFYSAKVNNVDNVQNWLLNLSATVKYWEAGSLNNEGLDLRTAQRDYLKLFGNLYNTSEKLAEYTQAPLRSRYLNLLSTHNYVFFSFIHLPHQHNSYEIEYGVGIKIKGEEIFKRLLNSTGTGIIEGLNSSTKYRVRMRVVGGYWGDIVEITTLDIPRFQVYNCTFVRTLNEGYLQFSKAGTLYGNNEIYFGTYRWVIKISSKNSTFDESETACMSVGVANKENKKAVFVGTTLNYGFNKDEILLRVYVNCAEKKMLIVNSTSTNQQEEIFQNLPVFPFYPTLINKGNSQATVRYSLVTDDPAIL